MSYPNTLIPGGSYYFVAPNNITVDGVDYPYAILSSGNYWFIGLTKSLYIAPNIVVTLYFTGSVNLSQSANRIRISAGSLVKFYMNSASFSVKGFGVENFAGCGSFHYFGLPINNTVTLDYDGGFNGMIYAPQAKLTIGPGTTGVFDFTGASVTKSVRVLRDSRFHFDENLMRIGPAR
ncbi:MAG: hypothetical protein EXS35_02425 [Pedosphaera sp.]|nr:hypothetical protein [Pedosphaera sp.]